MKVIFLDIDGVLNGDLFVRKCDKSGVLIDDTRLELIKRIVNETGAAIVLSSSWKEHWGQSDAECDETGQEINGIFADRGLCIFDKTPMYRNDKEQEIICWLREHTDVSEFVVIDDDPFAEDILRNHFVLTSHLRYGIDEYDAEKAVKILNGEA